MFDELAERSLKSPLAGTKHTYVRLAIIIYCQILALFFKNVKIKSRIFFESACMGEREQMSVSCICDDFPVFATIRRKRERNICLWSNKVSFWLLLGLVLVLVG